MYFKKLLLILLLANVALAMSCRDEENERINYGTGFFRDKAEIDCKREQECFPALFQNNWDGSYDTCFERTYDPDEATYLVNSMCCRYDSSAGAQCLESLENLTCDEGTTVVPAAALCDGVVDCNDGIDESNCSN